LLTSSSADRAAAYASCTCVITSSTAVSASATLARSRRSADEIVAGFCNSDNRSAASVGSNTWFPPDPTTNRRSIPRIGLGSSRAWFACASATRTFARLFCTRGSNPSAIRTAACGVNNPVGSSAAAPASSASTRNVIAFSSPVNRSTSPPTSASGTRHPTPAKTTTSGTASEQRIAARDGIGMQAVGIQVRKAVTASRRSAP
jgi:hypothetical protein